jgi:hypothetical protein
MYRSSVWNGSWKKEEVEIVWACVVIPANGTELRTNQDMYLLKPFKAKARLHNI